MHVTRALLRTGVCVKCRLDTVELVERIEHLDNKERRRELVRAGFQPGHGFTESRLIKLSCQTEWHSGIGAPSDAFACSRANAATLTQIKT
jgi:hypothetical protein